MGRGLGSIGGYVLGVGIVLAIVGAGADAADTQARLQFARDGQAWVMNADGSDQRQSSLPG